MAVAVDVLVVKAADSMRSPTGKVSSSRVVPVAADSFLPAQAATVKAVSAIIVLL